MKIVAIKSHSCYYAAGSLRCSYNIACTYLSNAIINDTNICGFRWVICSQLHPCENSTNLCNKSGYVCLYLDKCENSPLCYPESMSDQHICPLILSKMLKHFSESNKN